MLTLKVYSFIKKEQTKDFVKLKLLKPDTVPINFGRIKIALDLINTNLGSVLDQRWHFSFLLKFIY